jgi:hypothetical protein
MDNSSRGSHPTGEAPPEQPRTIFMAYASEDEELSITFKKQIETAFDGRLSVFVASSYDGLTPGRPWFEDLTTQLRASDIVLAMISRCSLRSAWIPFECGTAFGAGVLFIPLCHSGLKMVDLQQPLSNFQSLELTKQGHISQLVTVLSERLKLPFPRIDLASIAEMFEAADQLHEAWERFNECIAPIFLNNRSAFETLVRVGGNAQALVPHHYLDRLKFAADFCKSQGIMRMEIVKTTPSDAVVEMTRGKRFNVLVSRKCVIDDLLRIRTAA